MGVRAPGVDWNIEGDVTLKGSNVVLNKTTQITISAGSALTFFNNQPLSDVRKYYAIAIAETAHSFELTFQGRWADAINSTYAATANTQATTTTNNSSIPPTDVPTPECSLAIVNSDTVSHVYDVLLGGIR